MDTKLCCIFLTSASSIYLCVDILITDLQHLCQILLGAFKPVSEAVKFKRFIWRTWLFPCSTRYVVGKTRRRSLGQRASWANLTHMLLQPGSRRMAFGLVVAPDVHKILLDGGLTIDLKWLHHLGCISRSWRSLKQINMSALWLV